MTWLEAYEKTNDMKEMQGMYTTVSQAVPGNENSYYPDYKPHRSMSGGMGHMMEISLMHDRMEDGYYAIDGKTNAGQAPAGRSQKSHNLIQAMNKRKR